MDSFGASGVVIRTPGASNSSVLFAGAPGLGFITNGNPANPGTYLRRIEIRADRTIASDVVVASDKRGSMGGALRSCPDLNGDGWPDVVTTHVDSDLDSGFTAHVLIISGRDGAELGRYTCPDGAEIRTDFAVVDRLGAEGHPAACVQTSWPIGHRARIEVVDLMTRTRIAVVSNEDAAYSFRGAPCVVPDGSAGPGVLAIGAKPDGPGASGRIYLYHLAGFSSAGCIDGPVGVPSFGAALATRDARAKWADMQLCVGAPDSSPGAKSHGSVYCVSVATGKIINEIHSPDGAQEFGDLLAGVGDLDRDGVDDTAAHGVYPDPEKGQMGFYTIYSDKTLKPIGRAEATVLCRLDMGAQADDPILLLGRHTGGQLGLLSGDFRTATAASLLSK